MKFVKIFSLEKLAIWYIVWDEIGICNSLLGTFVCNIYDLLTILAIVGRA